MNKSNENSKNKNLGWLQVRAFFSGLLSYSNILFLVIMLSLVFIFRMCFLHENVYFQSKCLIWICGLISLVVICAMVKIFITKGESGPPEIYYKEGDMFIALINQALNVSEMHKIFPKLPAPDGIIEGEAKEEKSIKKLSKEEQYEWSKNDDIDTVKQAVAAITSPHDTIKIDEKIKLETEAAGESSKK